MGTKIMGTKFNVTLRPPTSGGKREYADEHELQISKQDDAGLEKITFVAINHSFVVVIPEADKLFFDPKKTVEPTLHFRVKAGTSVPTPTINGNVESGQKYEYHVFCEEEGDWAHKRGSSPPKIMILD